MMFLRSLMRNGRGQNNGNSTPAPGSNNTSAAATAGTTSAGQALAQNSSNVSSLGSGFDHSARLGTYSVDKDLQKPFKELYAVAHVVGSGSFSVVKYGYDRVNGTPVAVKQIKKQRLDPKDLEGLKTEIEILKELNHENVIKLYGFFQDKIYYYIVTEYMPGGNLFDRILKEKKLSFTEEDARRIIRTLGQGLKYCHDRGVVHRDLKPENILLSSEGPDATIKIADFGFAKKLQVDMMGRSINSLRTALGTPGYVAPEVLSGKIYGKPVDMWSLGVILYIMLCGYPPFFSEHDDDKELFAKIRRGDFEFDTEYWDTISDSAKNLVSGLLTLDMEKRLTVDQLLQHPWLTNDRDSKGRDITPALIQLQKFQERSRWTVGQVASVVNSSMTFGELQIRRQQEELAARAAAGGMNRPISTPAAPARNSIGATSHGQQRPKSLTENPITPIMEEARSAALERGLKHGSTSTIGSTSRRKVVASTTIAEGDEQDDSLELGASGLVEDGQDGTRSRSSSLNSLASTKSNRSLFRAFSKSSMRKLKTEEDQLSQELASEEASVMEAQSRSRSTSNVSTRSNATTYSVPETMPITTPAPGSGSISQLPPHARTPSDDSTRRGSGLLRISLGRKSIPGVSSTNPLIGQEQPAANAQDQADSVESQSNNNDVGDSYSYDPMSPSSLARSIPTLYAAKVPSFARRGGASGRLLEFEEKPYKKAYFTVFAPHVYPEDEIKLDIWAAIIAGKTGGGRGMRKGKKGPLKLTTGEVVTVKLSCPLDKFHLAYDEDIFEWYGEPENASFIVSCNSDTAPGSYPFRAVVSCEDQELGVLVFDLIVRQPSDVVDKQRHAPQDIDANLTIYPETSTGYHIFISHRPLYTEVAESVKTALEDFGYKVFLRSGEKQSGTYPKEIETILRGTPIFLPLFTPGPSGKESSLKRLTSIEAMKKIKGDWILHELTTALEAEFGEKLIVPIYKGVDIGQEWRHLPEHLDSIKGLNCRSLQDSSFADSMRLINTFIQRVCLSG